MNIIEGVSSIIKRKNIQNIIKEIQNGKIKDIHIICNIIKEYKNETELMLTIAESIDNRNVRQKLLKECSDERVLSYLTQEIDNEDDASEILKMFQKEKDPKFLNLLEVLAERFIENKDFIIKMIKSTKCKDASYINFNSLYKKILQNTTEADTDIIRCLIENIQNYKLKANIIDKNKGEFLEDEFDFENSENEGVLPIYIEIIKKINDVELLNKIIRKTSDVKLIDIIYKRQAELEVLNYYKGSNFLEKNLEAMSNLRFNGIPLDCLDLIIYKFIDCKLDINLYAKLLVNRNFEYVLCSDIFDRYKETEDKEAFRFELMLSAEILDKESINVVINNISPKEMKNINRNIEDLKYKYIYCQAEKGKITQENIDNIKYGLKLLELEGKIVMQNTIGAEDNEDALLSAVDRVANDENELERYNIYKQFIEKNSVIRNNFTREQTAKVEAEYYRIVNDILLGQQSQDEYMEKDR